MVDAQGGVFAGMINSENLDDVVWNSLSPREELLISGSLHLSNLTVLKDLNASEVMGINVQELSNDLVRTNKDYNISSLRFASEVTVNDINLQSINNERFPDDFVIRSTSHTNFGMKKFDNLTIGYLTVTGRVDSLDPNELAIKSYTDQEIKGTKTFTSGITIQGDLNIKSQKIDNIDISDLFKERSSNNAIVFSEEVEMFELNITGEINGQNMQKLKEDLILKTDRSVEIEGRKTFLKNLTANDGVKVTTINGISANSFVSRNMESSAYVIAPKTFTQEITFQDLNVDGNVDGVNLTDLMTNSLFLDIPNQIVSGIKNIKFIKTNLIDISNSVNAKLVDNLLTKSTSQDFNVSLTAQKIHFDDLTTDNFYLSDENIVNGIDFSYYIRHLQDHKFLGKHVTVKGNVKTKSLETDKINEHTINDINNKLRKESSTPQRVNSNISFQNVTVDGIMKVKHSLNKQRTSLRDIMDNAITLKNKKIVRNTTVWDEIIVDSANIGGKVNGIRVDKLGADSVFLDDPKTFSIKGKILYLCFFFSNKKFGKKYLRIYIFILNTF